MLNVSCDALHMQCILEVNGERKTDGTVSFWTVSNTMYVRVDAPGEFSDGPITMCFDSATRDSCAEFFASDDMLFWKGFIPEAMPPYSRVLCIVNFSCDDLGNVFHLSTDTGSDKNHMETPIPADIFNKLHSLCSKKQSIVVLEEI